VRCDGREGICGNCERLGFSCSFALAASPEQGDDAAQASSPEARPERRRVSKACDGCREQKVRCSGDTPQCTACKRRQLDCHYPSETRKRVRPVKRPKRPIHDEADEDVESSRAPSPPQVPQMATPISPQPSIVGTVVNDAHEERGPADLEIRNLLFVPLVHSILIVVGYGDADIQTVHPSKMHRRQTHQNWSTSSSMLFTSYPRTPFSTGLRPGKNGWTAR
jgi:hypothetical protein